MNLLNDPYQALKFEGTHYSKVSDSLTTEEVLQININGNPFTVIMRSPGCEKEQVIGLLFAERVLKKPQTVHIECTSYSKLGYVTQVDVHIPKEQLGKGFLNSRTLLSVSSCGICGKTELEDIEIEGNQLSLNQKFDVSFLPSMLELMRQNQATFQQTGGSHAAAAFNISGSLLAFAEDVGRHNAVDKVIGATIMNQSYQEARCLVVSGRVSYEIISKAFMARMPILAAVSAPSSLAVDFAKELGITLLGFCRGDKATCYSHPKRLMTHSYEQKQ